MRPLVFVCCLAIASFLTGQTVATGQPLADFDAYVQQAVAYWEVTGLAVAVVKDGDVLFAKGYGIRELGNPAKVDEHTLFAIGSTTKAMTAAAIGMLVDEGKLDWDDPVTDHLQKFRLYDPFVTREITIRDLLTHRAGLPNADFLWYGQESEADDILFRMRYVEPETSLRSSFTYQNIMYAAAGAVVAELSGMSWDAFIQKRIFEPLEMNGSIATAATLDAQPNVASPHYRVDGATRVIENASVDAVAPAGSVWSSVSDMAQWMRFLLEGKTRDGTELLSKETLEELFTPQTMVDSEEFYPTQAVTKPHWMTYGLGWFQQDYDGRAVDFHTGSIDGMVAIHGLIRDERLGVYVLGNLDHAEIRHALMYEVFDRFGEGSHRDWNVVLKDLYDGRRREAERRQSEAKKTRVLGTAPTLALERYTGTYADELYGTVRIAVDGDGLSLFYGPGLKGELEHWHYDLFRVHFDAAWRGSSLVSFELDRKGEVVRLSMGGASFVRRAKK